MVPLPSRFDSSRAPARSRAIALFSALLAAGGGLTAALAAAPSVEKVPPKLLDGDRLIVRECRCSVTSPGSGWTWFRSMGEKAGSTAKRPHAGLKSSEFFAVQLASNTAFSLFVSERAGKASAPDALTGALLREEFSKSLEAQ